MEESGRMVIGRLFMLQGADISSEVRNTRERLGGCKNQYSSGVYQAEQIFGCFAEFRGGSTYLLHIATLLGVV